MSDRYTDQPDGKWLCIEDGRNPGNFRWRPWPER